MTDSFIDESKLFVCETCPGLVRSLVAEIAPATAALPDFNRKHAHADRTISSITFLASPNTIIVLSM
jgi:hypothetical protein